MPHRIERRMIFFFQGENFQPLLSAFQMDQGYYFIGLALQGFFRLGVFHLGKKVKTAKAAVGQSKTPSSYQEQTPFLDTFFKAVSIQVGFFEASIRRKKMASQRDTSVLLNLKMAACQYLICFLFKIALNPNGYGLSGSILLLLRCSVNLDD